MISRLAQFFLMLLFILIWLNSYTSNFNLEQSKFFVVVFFASQAFSFLIISPLVIFLHTVILYKDLYYYVDKLFPLSHMLLTDLRDNAENLLEIQKDNKYL
jgi:hypothetical protein